MNTYKTSDHGFEYTIDEKGIVRWVSNGHVPPQESLEQIIADGQDIDIEANNDEREREIMAFLDEYRRNQPPQPSEEELFEMRAAFGTGTTVVNVFTGRRVHL